jgi:hypothetical protein
MPVAHETIKDAYIITYHEKKQWCSELKETQSELKAYAPRSPWKVDVTGTRESAQRVQSG